MEVRDCVVIAAAVDDWCLIKRLATMMITCKKVNNAAYILINSSS